MRVLYTSPLSRAADITGVKKHELIRFVGEAKAFWMTHDFESNPIPCGAIDACSEAVDIIRKVGGE